MAAPRDGGTDHLLKYGGEENIIPHDSQVFYSEYADQGILKWEEISVDSDRVDINYEEIDIGYDDKRREEMLKKSNGARTIPQIFIGEKHVGGYVELKALDNKGELDILLKN